MRGRRRGGRYPHGLGNAGEQLAGGVGQGEPQRVGQPSPNKPFRDGVGATRADEVTCGSGLRMACGELVQDACLMTSLTAGEPTHVDPASMPVLNHLDFLCRVVLPGEATGGSFSVIEERAQLGSMTPRHVHGREAETFIVLDGALEGWCEGQVRLVEAGQLIYLPPNREHAYRVASDSAHYYVLITPAGFETFFQATGTVLDQAFEGELPVPGPVPPERVGELQAVLTPLGATVTGPPPFAVY